MSCHPMTAAAGVRVVSLGGYQYTHNGPWVWASAESVAWCNLGDEIIGDWTQTG
ncbi:hypothetical protein QFZ49_006100 [Streptomyces turgidiscabies]|uniref:Uncharacterized protein n=1 Tax=Streptomyces turgidiscabies TaxID=85558 RepID=A0ABU0RVZ6_9ACTN|nr:hypothetical protein [Streptomyces turgidiscabies]